MSRCASFLWLLSFVLLGSSLRFEDWHCGTEEASRNISYQTIVDDCPDFLVELNHCCVVHDDCYAKQFGQEKCDDNFCKCNKVALNRTGGDRCKSHVSVVCILMPFFGMPAYEASVNYTEPDDMPKYIPQSPLLSREYSELYRSCPEVNSTISSCSLQIDECSYGAMDCAEQLCNCLNDAHQIDNSTSCLSTTARICTLAMEDARLTRSRKQLVELALTILLMIASVCCLSMALYWFYMKMKEKTYSREVKYIPVA